MPIKGSHTQLNWYNNGQQVLYDLKSNPKQAAKEVSANKPTNKQIPFFAHDLIQGLCEGVAKPLFAEKTS